MPLRLLLSRPAATAHLGALTVAPLRGCQSSRPGDGTCSSSMTAGVRRVRCAGSRRMHAWQLLRVLTLRCTPHLRHVAAAHCCLHQSQCVGHAEGLPAMLGGARRSCHSHGAAACNHTRCCCLPETTGRLRCSARAESKLSRLRQLWGIECGREAAGCARVRRAKSVARENPLNRPPRRAQRAASGAPLTQLSVTRQPARDAAAPRVDAVLLAQHHTLPGSLLC